MTIVCRTVRLLLREMTGSDLDFVARMLGDPEVMHHYPRPLDRAASRAWIERQGMRYARDGYGLWLVVRKVDGAPVGQVGIVQQSLDGIGVPELGYLIDRRWWRHGYALEAASAVREHAFGVRGLSRLVSFIRPANRPSLTLSRRLGMHKAGVTLHAGLTHLVFELHNPTAAVPRAIPRAVPSAGSC